MRPSRRAGQQSLYIASRLAAFTLRLMRVLVAGAAGAIGRQLVPMLVRGGHEVYGTTRAPERAEWLRASGAKPIVLDVYDAAAVREAMDVSRPAAVIHQLTDLAAGFRPEQLRANARLRRVGTRHLVDAMLATSGPDSRSGLVRRRRTAVTHSAVGIGRRPG